MLISGSHTLSANAITHTARASARCLNIVHNQQRALSAAQVHMFSNTRGQQLAQSAARKISNARDQKHVWSAARAVSSALCQQRFGPGYPFCCER